MKGIEDKSGKALARKDSFAEKVKAFRVATGKLERFTTECACALHDKAFLITYERAGPAEKWRIGAIDKIVGQERRGGGGESAKPRLLDVPLEDVDETGWACPWCQCSSDFVYCTQCSTFVCARRVREEEGQRKFRCRDSCGASGLLGPLVSMKGTGTDAPKALSPKAGLLPRSAPHPALPGSAHPALGKPKR